MTTAIAIFVKTPGLSPIKTRLAARVGTAGASAFYILSINAVSDVVRDFDASVFWAVAEKAALNDPMWRGFSCLSTGDGDLGERQHHVYETLLTRHDRVLLIGADAPQLSSAHLDAAVTALNRSDFVIGPTRDGGYYLFGGRISLHRSVWTSVPWSTSETRRRLENGLPSNPGHLSILTDVDSLNDLQYVPAEMPDNMNDGQKRVLKWITNHFPENKVRTTVEGSLH